MAIIRDAEEAPPSAPSCWNCENFAICVIRRQAEQVAEGMRVAVRDDRRHDFASSMYRLVADNCRLWRRDGKE